MKPARNVAPEAAAAAAILAAVLAVLAPMWLRGLTPFWGDLTYLHPAWRAAPAQLIQAGRAPLWEPSLYLGMPMAASMQGGLFYPPTLAYFLFGFANATALFHLLHYFLAGWLAALWLRTLRLNWGACAAAGISFALGGLMIGHASFLNHLAVLAWAPALPLFFRRRGPLALALALMFLAGYPTFLPGLAIVAWALALALRARRAAKLSDWSIDWAAAVALALALTAAQLLPALALARESRRAGGLPLDEVLRYGFTLTDLRQWVSPLFVPLRAFQPAVEWWKCVYLGVAASAAAGLALLRLPRRRAAALAALLAAVVLLILGGSNPLSRALWVHLPGLSYVRYPGNFAYLAALPLTALVGAGLSRAARAPVLAALLVAELVYFGARAIPGAPRAVFSDPGPLARELQGELGGTRYLLSPKALEDVRGSGIQDWASRLYGLSNAPSRLRSVGNFGEPLVPAPNYAVMDRLYSARSVEEAAAWMPWIGASRLLTPEQPSTPLLVTEGLDKWWMSRASRPVALAYQFPPAAGAALPEDMPASPPPAGKPLAETREREDRFTISGEGEGWVYVAEPRYPGWSAQLESQDGVRRIETSPALGAFLKAAVPAGPWTLTFEYDDADWRQGVLLSLGALLAFGSYWYHRASSPSHVPK